MKRPSFLKSEKYLLNELSEAEKKDFEKQLENDPEAQAHLNNLATTQSKLSWNEMKQKIALSSEAETVSRKRVQKQVHSTSLPDKLQSLFDKAFSPRLALAGSFILLLTLLPIFYLTTQPENGFRSKGRGIPEVILAIHNQNLVSGKSVSAITGDVLTFSYRSTKPLYTQIWYSEDKSAPQLFDGRKDSSILWPASSSWAIPSQRIQLEGNWKTQQVYIVTSLSKLTNEKAKQFLLLEEKPSSEIHIFSYTLNQP